MEDNSSEKHMQEKKNSHENGNDEKSQRKEKMPCKKI